MNISYYIISYILTVTDAFTSRDVIYIYIYIYIYMYVLVSEKLLNKQPRYMWFEALWLLKNYIMIWKRFPHENYFAMESIAHRLVSLIKASIRHCVDYFLVGVWQDVEQTIELPVIWDAKTPYDFTVMKTQFTVSNQSLMQILVRLIIGGLN